MKFCQHLWTQTYKALPTFKGTEILMKFCQHLRTQTYKAVPTSTKWLALIPLSPSSQTVSTCTQHYQRKGRNSSALKKKKKRKKKQTQAPPSSTFEYTSVPEHKTTGGDVLVTVPVQISIPLIISLFSCLYLCQAL